MEQYAKTFTNGFTRGGKNRRPSKDGSKLRANTNSKGENQVLKFDISLTDNMNQEGSTSGFINEAGGGTSEGRPNEIGVRKIGN